VSGRREQARGGQERKGLLLLRGCSCRATPPATAWQTRGAGEAAADVNGPVEGARARGNSSSGGARKGTAPPGRSSSGGAPPLAAWNGAAMTEKKERRERKIGSRQGGKEDGFFFKTD